MDRDDVVAINHDAGNAVACRARRNVAQRVCGCGRCLRRVHVVLAHVEHRQLPGRRDVEALVERSRVRCAVAEEGHRDALLTFHLRRKARAGDDRDAAGDDAVGAEHADAEIGDVHGSAFALAVAGLAPVELGHHAVEVGALGDAVAMPAMRRDDPVTAVERGTDADGDRFLTDVAVHDAVDLAGIVVGRGSFLEAADGEHLAQHFTLLVGRQVRREAHGHGAILLGRSETAMMGAGAKAGNRRYQKQALLFCKKEAKNSYSFAQVVDQRRPHD